MRFVHDTRTRWLCNETWPGKASFVTRAGVSLQVARGIAPGSGRRWRIAVAALRRREDRLNAQFDVRLVDHADVVAEELAQDLVDHRRAAAAADVVAELRLDHREGAF